MKHLRSGISLSVQLSLWSTLAIAEPARFWISTSNSQITGYEAPILSVPSGSTQQLFIWCQPGESLHGAKSLQSISLDIVTKDTSVGAFQRDGIVVYNNPQRFEYTIDSGHGFPQSAADDQYGICDSLTNVCSLRLGAGQGDEGLHGIAGYSIFNTSLNGIGTDANQPCDFTTHCAMTTVGPAWLFASVMFQALSSSGEATYHLQIGDAGMKYYDPTLTETDVREDARVVFGADVIDTNVTYDAGACNPVSGLCAQRQFTYDNDLPDLTIRAVEARLPGDYNGDSFVEFQDYAVFRNTFGQAGVGLPADSNSDGVVDAADYLLWRKNLVPVIHDSLGDYNQNNRIDRADYALWRGIFGQSGQHLLADGSGDGIVDTADYVLWRHRFPSVVVLAPGNAFSTMVTNDRQSGVPEPATGSLVSVVLLLIVNSRVNCRINH